MDPASKLIGMGWNGLKGGERGLKGNLIAAKRVSLGALGGAVLTTSVLMGFGNGWDKGMPPLVAKKMEVAEAPEATITEIQYELDETCDTAVTVKGGAVAAEKVEILGRTAEAMTRTTHVETNVTAKVCVEATDITVISQLEEDSVLATLVIPENAVRTHLSANVDAAETFEDKHDGALIQDGLTEAGKGAVRSAFRGLGGIADKLGWDGARDSANAKVESMSEEMKGVSRERNYLEDVVGAMAQQSAYDTCASEIRDMTRNGIGNTVWGAVKKGIDFSSQLPGSDPRLQNVEHEVIIQTASGDLIPVSKYEGVPPTNIEETVKEMQEKLAELRNEGSVVFSETNERDCIVPKDVEEKANQHQAGLEKSVLETSDEEDEIR